MKKIYWCLQLLAIASNGLLAQVPSIQWQKCYGGTSSDEIYYTSKIIQTSDGGLMIAGYSFSNDGDVSGFHGGICNGNIPCSDGWIVKLDSLGSIQWQKSIGGTSDDYLIALREVNNGYIVCGSTVSNDGDVNGNHSSPNFSDAWLIKLDFSGNIIWQRCFGGSSGEGFYDLVNTSDGGYIAVGITYTNNDGDVSGGHSNSASQDIYDIWVVKTDSLGDLQWQRCLGGTNRDNANSIQQTDDGGYIVAGGTGSIDGDVTGLHGGLYSDFWIVKLDSVGVLQWQKCLGGTMYEEAYSIKKLVNGNFIISGITSSNDGDVSGLHGSNLDYWIVKINSSGILLWQRCYGGTDLDEAYSVDTTSDGGFIISGYTTSFDGNVTGNHGGFDYWVVKLNNAGYLQWQKCFGGSGSEWSSCIIQTRDNGYVIYGETGSNDYDVIGNHGDVDLWVVKLSLLPDGEEAITNPITDFAAHQNPVIKTIDVSFYFNGKVNAIIQLIDITGRILLQDAFSATNGLNKHQIFTGDLVGGIYFVRLQTNGGAVTKKVVVQ